MTEVASSVLDVTLTGILANASVNAWGVLRMLITSMLPVTWDSNEKLTPFSVPRLLSNSFRENVVENGVGFDARTLLYSTTAAFAALAHSIRLPVSTTDLMFIRLFRVEFSKGVAAGQSCVMPEGLRRSHASGRSPVPRRSTVGRRQQAR